MDVKLFQTNDGGDISVDAGLVELSAGLDTAVYLSMFGGNYEDDGSQDSAFQFWGNIGEAPERKYRSETQYLLRSIPAIPFNLKRIEDAIKRDLAWMIPTAATEIAATVALIAPKKIKITVAINATGNLVFIENWTNA